MKKVFMYTLSTCPWCKKAKKFMADHKVPFEFVDYDLQPPEKQKQIVKEMQEKGSSFSFPWVLIDDELVVGWNPERYEELLGLRSKAEG